jgi:hypothetical protein
MKTSVLAFYLKQTSGIACRVVKDNGVLSIAEKTAFDVKLSEPLEIIKTICDIIDDIKLKYPDICSVGFTAPGNICYLSKNGRYQSVNGNFTDSPGADERMSPDEIYRRTGLVPSPDMMLFKLFADKSPHFFETVHTLPDMLIAALTGTAVFERSQASCTGLLSLETETFDSDIELAFGLGCYHFPKLSDCKTVVGQYNGLSVTAVVGLDIASAAVTLPAGHTDTGFFYEPGGFAGALLSFQPRTELTGQYGLSILTGCGGSYILGKLKTPDETPEGIINHIGAVVGCNYKHIQTLTEEAVIIGNGAVQFAAKNTESPVTV